MSAAGKFFGIGVGPGDPELLTLKAARILAAVECDLPAGNRNGPGRLRGRIIESLRLDANKFRPIALCMSRNRDADEDAYDKAAQQIGADLEHGKSAAWITEGDPLFFSTFLHVWAALRRRSPQAEVEIVPGVTSVQAAAAFARFPLAALGESIAIVPAAYGIDHLPDILRDFPVVCLLKVHAVFDRLLDQLAQMPQAPDAVYVEKVGTAEQRLVHDLCDAARASDSLFFARAAAPPGKEASVTAAGGRIFVVGVGPGHADLLTPQAARAIGEAEVIVGYAGYFPWVEQLIAGKERIALPLGQERERAALALEHAARGRTVAVISSGDPGIYAMASVVLEMLGTMELDARPRIEIVPGVSALNAAAALLGAPLGHDFAAISLSDLLTPWRVIEDRLAAAAGADFVLALFNPKSERRDWQLARAREILLGSRPAATPVGIVRNAFRPDQSVCVTTLDQMNPAAIDMFTIVIIGNRSTRLQAGMMLTPRGYDIAPTAKLPIPPRKPEEITAESFRIIEAEIGPHPFGALEWPIVRRMIHAAGDVELARSVRFTRRCLGGGAGGARAARRSSPTSPWCGPASTRRPPRRSASSCIAFSTIPISRRWPAMPTPPAARSPWSGRSTRSATASTSSATPRPPF